MIASTRLRKLMRILPCATLAMIMPLRADHAMSADQSKPQTSAKPRKQSLPASTAPQQPATEKTEPATECAVESIDARSNQRVTYSVPLPTPGSRKRVSACMLPPKQAAKQVKDGLLFVDVRAPDAFARYRIPGSLNLPLSFVKTKAFLKQRSFALVNEGRQSGELEATCNELRAASFKGAFVLQGGLSAWRTSKGSIDGDSLSLRDLSRMGNAELAQEANYSDWLMLSVAHAPLTDVRAVLPQAVAVDAGADDRKLVAAVKAVVSKRARKGTDLKVLIVDDDGARNDKLDAALTGVVPQSLFFLEGGLAGYRKFWSDQATLWAAASRPPRKPACGA
jgi:rhodanese-related sulfurtransferase